MSEACQPVLYSPGIWVIRSYGVGCFLTGEGCSGIGGTDSSQANSMLLDPPRASKRDFLVALPHMVMCLLVSSGVVEYICTKLNVGSQ
jgi:hypothetical protein